MRKSGVQVPLGGPNKGMCSSLGERPRVEVIPNILLDIAKLVQFQSIPPIKENMATKVKTTIVTIDEAEYDGFRAPSNYYIVNCMGDLVFISAKKRDVAQKVANEEYGEGKYTIRSWKV